MKVLDASFLIDYLDGVEATKSYLQAHADEPYILPAPAYAEVLLGEGNGLHNSNVDGISDRLAWGEVVEVDDSTAITAAEIADEIGPQGPFLAGIDALIAAVGREFDAAVVSSDSDLTHEAVQAVIQVDEYL